MPSTTPGRLWIVATPLGNPGDFSPRAREIVQRADAVLCEDTRRTGLLFSQCGLTAPRLVSFHDRNEETRLEEALRRLREGAELALVSDAGTPLVADPGYRLVRACRAEGIAVSPVPGPSAPVAALSAAGLPPLPYTFLGFLPRDDAGRRQTLSAFARTPGSLVFFERKDRLRASLAVAAALLGPREAAICRELTKTHEEFILFRLEDFDELSSELLGEVTVILGPPEEELRADVAEARACLRRLAASSGQRLRPKELARQAHALLPGWSIKELYELLTDDEDGTS
ncbi:16S rRNA (cytidine(1402)-2'-O)-methyltransferase [uncultured Desulfovibrio sp.]|uniref:16S rRNA (cytidine(1402)-2'-O)-methyltransferase n=2 Tax=uncultured Desulfovibrio sp. TaxID=167968 RepID=UPI0026296B2A|nr:16S rRNA (cytidine(1402)-2'-O)-methyltransferase [uncultured Desulfovibrio sp.]